MSDFGTKRHIGLGLSLAAAQEQFSKAFILAAAYLAGCSVAEPKLDDNSIDSTPSCRLVPRRPKLDLQLKSHRLWRARGGNNPCQAGHPIDPERALSAATWRTRRGGWPDKLRNTRKGLTQAAENVADANIHGACAVETSSAEEADG